MELISTFLKQRAERSYRYLQEQITDVTPEEALRGRLPNWPDHRWGIGQNGSIAGIVYHVAAWKQRTLPVFQPGGQVLSLHEFDFESAPDASDWPGICVWLKEVGTAWLAEMALLPDTDFEALRAWEGNTMSVAAFLSEMIDHDIQHASQIEYLRQLYRALNTTPVS